MVRFPRSRTAAFYVILLAAVVTLQWRHVGRLLGSHGSRLAEESLAPPLDLTDALGRTVPASDTRGRPLIVTFWAAWCAPCRLELPELAAVVEKWNEQTADSDHAVLLAVNESDEVESLSTFFADPRLRSVRFAFDKTGATGARWGVKAYPTTVLVDKGGRVRQIQEGYDRRMATRLDRFLRGDGSGTQP